MRFKEKLILTLRGYRMLHQLVPGAMLWAFVQNLVRSLTPFLNVYLSGRIIDFLAQGRPLRDLLWLVGITVIVLSLIHISTPFSAVFTAFLPFKPGKRRKIAPFSRPKRAQWVPLTTFIPFSSILERILVIWGHSLPSCFRVQIPAWTISTPICSKRSSFSKNPGSVS